MEGETRWESTRRSGSSRNSHDYGGGGGRSQSLMSTNNNNRCCGDGRPPFSTYRNLLSHSVNSAASSIIGLAWDSSSLLILENMMMMNSRVTEEIGDHQHH